MSFRESEEEKSEIEISGQDVHMQCPKCGGNMVGVRYDTSLRILPERSWNTCMSCGHDVDMLQWKMRLFTT